MKCMSIGLPAVSRSTGADARPSEAGFTLVEVLCASAIAALSLAMLLQGFGGSLGAVHRLEDHVGARIVAQSVLADARQAAGVALGSVSGTQGKYRWEVAGRPASGEFAALAPAGMRLYRLTVKVTWRPHGSLELASVKLAR